MRGMFIADVPAEMLWACVPCSGEYGELNHAGSFSGVWHGWLAPSH